LKQTLEPDKRARVLRDLARLNLQLFNHAESEKLFIEAMGILESLPNKEQDLAGVVMEIGNVYRATARYADAEGYTRRALELREKVKPQNADRTAYLLYSLANIFYQQSRYREAKPFAERGLELRKSKFPPTPIAVALHTVQLGTVERALGKYTIAGQYLNDALTSYLKEGTEDDSSVALVPLGILRRDQGELVESKSILRKVVQIRERARGPEDDSVAYASSELAETLRLLGEYDDSEVAYRRALLIRERVLGKNHPGVARAMQGLAALYRKQGGAVQAEILLRRSLEIFRETVGAKVPYYARCEREIASVYMESGRLDEALALVSDASEIFQDHLTLAHQETVEALRTQAELLSKLGKTTEATEIERKAAEGLKGLDPTAALLRQENPPKD